MQLRLHAFVLLLFLAAAPLLAQNAMIGTGFANGWNYPADVVNMSPSLGGSFIYISQPAAVGDNYFRFVRTTDDNQFGPFDCVDLDWTGNQGISYDDMGVCDPFGAFFLNATNTDHNYVFKTRFENNDDFMYFVVEGDVFEFIPGQTAQDPMPDDMGRVNPDATVVVATVAAFSPGQTAYLRYTTDGFATSTVVEMLDQQGIFVYEASIPAQPAGTTVEYYLFSSGTGSAAPAADGSDADYKTITFENNGGTNFSYTTDAALPVTYRSFGGRRQADGKVELNWATASEDEASHFSVERSTDNGREWMTCGQVAAMNKDEGATYRFLDVRSPQKSLLYRLRQVDFDGRQELSSIVQIAGTATLLATDIYPNPVAEQLNLSIENFDPVDGPAEVIVTSIDGRTQLRQRLNAASVTVDTRSLPGGVYLLRIYRNGKLRGSQKFVKF